MSAVGYQQKNAPRIWRNPSAKITSMPAGITYLIQSYQHFPIGLPSFPSFTASKLFRRPTIHAKPISAIALGSGYRQHRSWLRLAIGTAGLALMFVGVSHLAGRALEPPLTIAGVSLVVLAHMLNIRQALAASDHPPARD